uniref:Uncharacterized protein n=1 Tax=Arundo donax TaxID=35708 RepID=A0A0A8Z439_ARUDO
MSRSLAHKPYFIQIFTSANIRCAQYCCHLIWYQTNLP